jgi:hypothetical protein
MTLSVSKNIRFFLSGKETEKPIKKKAGACRKQSSTALLSLPMAIR